jgi:sugar phosphate isomerase/epimerase
MKKNIDLVASYWTFAGTLPGARFEYSPFSFRSRVEAVSRAGFRGFGIWHSDLEHIQESLSLSDMKTILDDNGIKHVELEFLVDWFLDGERKKRSDRQKLMLFRAAEALGARFVKVGDFFNEKVGMPKLIDSFAGLCREASGFGTKIAFEPMSAATVHSLKDSLALVEGAGAENGGLAVDLWHMINQDETYRDIGRLPLSRVLAVEVSDALILASAPKDHRAGDPRRFCGEGEFDIKGFIESVNSTGYCGAWGVEILSPLLSAMTVEEVAAKTFRTTMAQFD